MKFSHDNSHSLVSDFTNLILYQETVQAEFNLGMTTLAKSWFSVVSLEAAQSTGFSNTVQNTALRALWFRLFSECRSPLLKTTFESTARPLGMFRPRDSWKLQNGHWLYLDPSFPLTAHSLIVPSQLAVLAQGTLSGRDCHIPSGREWTQLFTASQQNGFRAEGFFAILSGLPSREEGLNQLIRMKCLLLFSHLHTTPWSSFSDQVKLSLKTRNSRQQNPLSRVFYAHHTLAFLPAPQGSEMSRSSGTGSWAETEGVLVCI